MEKLASPRNETSTHSCHTNDNQSNSLPYSFKYNVTTIHISQGSIVDVEGVDAVVNIARSDMEHNKGTAFIVSVRAGLKMAEEGRKYVKEHGQLKECETLVTCAGTLPYKGIIHCVVPKRWRTYSEINEYLMKLRKTISNILHTAVCHGFFQIAMPSDDIISADFKQCAEVCVKAIVDYSKQKSSLHISDVHFVDNKASIQLAIREACEKLKTEYIVVSPKDPKKSTYQGSFEMTSGQPQKTYHKMPSCLSPSTPGPLCQRNQLAMESTRFEEIRQGSTTSPRRLSDGKYKPLEYNGQETSQIGSPYSRPLSLSIETSNERKQTNNHGQISPQAVPVRSGHLSSRGFRQLRSPHIQEPRQYSYESTVHQTGLENTPQNTSGQFSSQPVSYNGRFSIEMASPHQVSSQGSLELTSPNTGLNRTPRARSRQSFSSDSRPVSARAQEAISIPSYQSPGFHTTAVMTPRSQILLAPSESRPLSRRDQTTIRLPSRTNSVEPMNFQTGQDIRPRERATPTPIIYLSVPVDNRPLSERVRQGLTTQPNELTEEFTTPIQETESDLPYKMDSIPIGICLIINNRVFSNNLDDTQQLDLSTRHGTERDAESLKAIFTKLGFIVKMKENLTDHEMNRELSDIALHIDHQKYDCFVCCILSHGIEGHVFGSNGKSLEIRHLTSLVRPSMCPSLGGKPKLFFIQACQGQEKQKGIEIEVDEPGIFEDALIAPRRRQLISNELDFLIGYSTVPGYVSFRNPVTGTWYINKLVDMLDRYHQKMDLLSILENVNEELSKMEDVDKNTHYKQTPGIFSTLRGKVHFRTRLIPE